MNIGIIDADLIGRKKHRFPNLCSMKISGYYKNGGNVTLITEYDRDELEKYDKIFLSKVFTDTEVPEWVFELKNISYGGTGFYYDKAPNLPDEIEHHIPDYHLYDKWVNTQLENGGKKKDFVYYTDYSIGFMTRGCFRKCPFCVNKKYDHVFIHSPLSEFLDENRKKICLLDDNIFGCPQWKEIFVSLQATGKKFQFKQGMDERILTDEKCRTLFESNYDGDYIFAFDNISDYDLIHKKLQLIRKYNKKSGNVKFYVLVGFESTDATDIENMWKRVELLMRYQCLPYIMRYQNKNETPWKDSQYRGMYVNMARWCNQPAFFKKKSFREFCQVNQDNMSESSKKAGKLCSATQALVEFEKEYPEMVKKYFDLRFDQMSIIDKENLKNIEE